MPLLSWNVRTRVSKFWVLSDDVHDGDISPRPPTASYHHTTAKVTLYVHSCNVLGSSLSFRFVYE